MENHYRGERDGGKCKIRGGVIQDSGERIVKLCEKQQISQRELARRIGVTSSQISRILKGETKTINSDMLMALAQEFGVSTDYILGIVNNPENTQSVENTENLAAEIKGHGGTQGTAVSHADASDEFCFSAWRLHRFY